MHFEAQNFCFFAPCAGVRHGGGLQSAPNLHKDKKNKSFELQRAPNLHRDQKKTKKNKENQSTGEESTIRLKFLFFCPCAGLVHFEVQNFCFFGSCAGLVHFEAYNVGFFVPVQVLCTFKFKTQCMVTCVL